MLQSGAQGFCFPKDALSFLSDLKANNSKEWFAENKPRFESSVQAPSKVFVEIMLPMLEGLAGHVLTAKIFRIHRDLRFSKDKTPYKPYQHFLFAPVGRGKSGPALFFALEPEKLFVGAGMFDFSREELDRFRRLVLCEEGTALAQILRAQINDGRRLREPSLKKVPRGFDANHERADLLRHKGLSVWQDIDDPHLATRPDFIELLEQQFTALLPVYRWLSDHVVDT